MDKLKNFSPVIISASRATDIPALYSDWFIHRLKSGYVIKENPFNTQKYKINFDQTQLIVFWSKNPEPIISKLDYFDDYFPNYYFQFTLNNYDKIIEPKLPSLNKRIDTFIKLSERLGKERLIWRFDPLLLTEAYNINKLIEKIEFVAKQVHIYTNKLVFSFIDIEKYRKVKKNLKKSDVNIFEFNTQFKLEMAKVLSLIGKKYNLTIASCAEEIDLKSYGIEHNKCIDDYYLRGEVNNNEIISNFFLRNKNLKDKGQRKECACILSKDIGKYNTCIHSCVYCYANMSSEVAKKNFLRHQTNGFKEQII